MIKIAAMGVVCCNRERKMLFSVREETERSYIDARRRKYPC